MANKKTDLLTLCYDLSAAGIWLYLNKQGGLVAGPTHLVRQYPALLDGLRSHKEEILGLLKECLVQEIFGEQAGDARFAQEVCPDCGQSVYIGLSPRRLGVHRLPGNLETCPGSDRAQATTAATIMAAFVQDRCLPRKGAVLTWIGIRGALGAWCTRRQFLLPPRPFLLAWMDTHYTRCPGDEEMPRWEGLQLTLEEWLGDQPPDTVEEKKPSIHLPKKLVLKA